MSHDPWPAPAKLNLFLHILGRRADGYHDLQTVFRLVDFGDELHIRPRTDSALNLDGNRPDIPPKEDLIYRAADRLRRATGCRAGADITVHKRIPEGGGLGGGSSDAATTLVALNSLWGCGLDSARLATIGLELGADVPVFVHGHSAFGEGLGERLTPLSLSGDWYLVVDPGCRVETARIFAHPDLTRHTPAITIRDFQAGLGHNDCEAVVFREFPAIREVADWLERYTRAHLTGTGACLFGRFGSRIEAESAAHSLPGPWRGFVARGVDRSPLIDRLARETG